MENVGKESAENLAKIYSNFMMRVQMFEDLANAGTRFLSGFQQALGYLGRPLIDTSSTFVDHILKEHRTGRVISYIESGCKKADDVSRSFSKLNASHLGLQDHVKQGKMILDELRNLIDEAAETLFQTSPDEAAADYAFTMGVVYTMVKQDFEMQIRIVSSLSVKTSTGEMETYSRMWALRPYVDDEMMHKAWRIVR